MAKVKRSVLKKLIKECLVEILIEGIDSESGATSLVEAVRPRRSSNNSSKEKYDTEMKRLQSKRNELDQQKVNSPVSDELINNLTSDATMADILRDTAATTLVEQGLKNSNTTTQSRNSADRHSKIVADNNLEDLFESAGNWANLAFSNVDNKS